MQHNTITFSLVTSPAQFDYQVSYATKTHQPTPDHANHQFSLPLPREFQAEPYAKERQVARLIRQAVRSAYEFRIKHLSFCLEDLAETFELDTDRMFEILSIQIPLAGYRFLNYKSSKSLEDLTPLAVNLVAKNPTDLQNRFNTNQTITTIQNQVRDLCNTRGHEMTPEIMVDTIEDLISDLPLDVEIFDEHQIKEMGMGGLHAVGRGSQYQPRLAIIRYNGGNNEEKPLVLVGKGITYDTGGLHVKPAGYMHEMNHDMSGAAVVLGAIIAAAKLRSKQNIVALLPLAENAVSGDAYRPGDILSMYDNQTVEVLHTDAEGRLVMADAIAYAHRDIKPKQIITLATLTGAALVALGERANAVMSEQHNTAQEIVDRSQGHLEPSWSLPLWPEFAADIKGSHSDLTNIHHKKGRYGGTIIAGTFLRQFAGDTPYAHIDMAPRMVSIAEDHLEPGSTGEPMRTILDLLQN